jgi:hypothetical protein
MIKYLEMSKNPAIKDHLRQLQDIQCNLFFHLYDAQLAYNKIANKHNVDSSRVELKFSIGNQVWLLRRNVKTTRSCDKLDF